MTKKEYLESTDRCELCGSPKKLEIHHIIPLCTGAEDCIDNWIAICSSCHSRLTPKSQLTKLGLKRIKAQNAIIEIQASFYERLNEIANSESNIDCIDVLDIFDSIYDEFGSEALKLIYVKSRRN